MTVCRNISPHENKSRPRDENLRDVTKVKLLNPANKNPEVENLEIILINYYKDPQISIHSGFRGLKLPGEKGLSGIQNF